MTEWGDVIKTLEQRDEVQEKIVQSLAHFDRATAMHLILAWFSIKDLEAVAPTLSGNPNILEKEANMGEENEAANPPQDLTKYVPDDLPEEFRWKGEGPPPAYWYVGSTKVYRSYADYCDD